MTKYKYRFVSVVALLLVLSASGAEPKKDSAQLPPLPVDKSMTVWRALHEIKDAIAHNPDTGYVRFNAKGYTYNGKRLEQYYYTDMQLLLPAKRRGPWLCVDMRGSGPFACWDKNDFAYVQEFISAMNRMIWEYTPEGQAQAASAKQALEAWRTLPVKPAMPEEVHAHQVLAANAYQEKNYDKAIDEYEAALGIFPTWPEGQFNLALVCSETGDYDCAVEHMQDYLELVPDAPNAQAAKDNLIIWKDKLAQEQTATAPPAATQKEQKGHGGMGAK